MKPHIYRLLLIAFLFAGGKASALQLYTLSGRVTDSLGVVQKSATVFISGTTRFTISDEQGNFKFEQLLPGTYQLSVSMIGFYPYSQNVVIRNEAVNVAVSLKSKITVLREVVIGPNNRAEYMKLFKLAFLGQTDNAKKCDWKNPDAIHFTYSKKTHVLTADADELLVIDNKQLGYRVKYLLKAFTYDTFNDIALYDGETNFEELPGTAKMKATWNKNRLNAYNGSMMQFLRAVYNGNTLQQGYAVYNIIKDVSVMTFISTNRLVVDPTPLNVNDLLTRVDSALTSMKFKSLYIDYVGTKKSKLEGVVTRSGKLEIEPVKKSSILNLIVKEALIDRRGSYTDYQAFYLHGFMAEKRVGDQLPFEYQPPGR